MTVILSKYKYSYMVTQAYIKAVPLYTPESQSDALVIGCSAVNFFFFFLDDAVKTIPEIEGTMAASLRLTLTQRAHQWERTGKALFSLFSYRLFQTHF